MERVVSKESVIGPYILLALLYAAYGAALAVKKIMDRWHK
jgi:hypothetical protein